MLRLESCQLTDSWPQSIIAGCSLDSRLGRGHQVAGGAQLAQALHQAVGRRGGGDEHAAGLHINVDGCQLPQAAAEREAGRRVKAAFVAAAAAGSVRRAGCKEVT